MSISSDTAERIYSILYEEVESFERPTPEDTNRSNVEIDVECSSISQERTEDNQVDDNNSDDIQDDEVEFESDKSLCLTQIIMLVRRVQKLQSIVCIPMP
ncbi:hypothetical protein A0J61_10109 [Choanephora cucurbitarum]|uniref:Uncharacterized protein n=1 Tax=Choanephora cucurbitarum TaxID=101091 RepID=A0A1C7MYF4_9FUNG|nr:hypothetical protein A0J61_10109 [Choanephora cucurbitarum]